MKRFVIVVDMQHDFVAADGALPVPDAEAIVAPMREWLAGLSASDTAGVLFTRDTHIPEIYAGSAEAQQFPLHCVKDGPGWALTIDPAVVDAEIPTYTLEKSVFDMWEEPGLVLAPCDGGEPIEREAFFASLRAGGIDDVTVVGVAADYCVRWAVEGLMARGFRVSVIPALTRGIVRSAETVAAEEWQGRLVMLVQDEAPLETQAP